MAAKDLFHDAVKRALEKDGWTITHDPLFISFGGVEMYVDLGADYLAIPVDAEREFFRLELPRRLIERYRVRLVIYDPEEETIVKWAT